MTKSIAVVIGLFFALLAVLGFSADKAHAANCQFYGQLTSDLTHAEAEGTLTVYSDPPRPETIELRWGTWTSWKNRAGQPIDRSEIRCGTRVWVEWVHDANQVPCATLIKAVPDKAGRP